MPRIALATSSKYPNLTDDDRLLLAPLSTRNIEAEPTIWNEPRNWSLFNAVIIRSCWDYHLQPEKFLHWISALEGAQIPVFNPTPIIRWNSDKAYLRDLEAKGIAAVPTFWPGPAHQLSLSEKLHELAWPKAVVKPRISATAYRTQLVTANNAASAQPLFDDLRVGPGVMVQKFIDSIATEGEWSLMFFSGAFSHSRFSAKPRSSSSESTMYTAPGGVLSTFSIGLNTPLANTTLMPISVRTTTPAIFG